MTRPPELAPALAALRAVAGGGGRGLDAAQARALLDELARREQSSDFLRRQNLKLRRRIERLKGGAGDEA